jgi:hypothetical protein
MESLHHKPIKRFSLSGNIYDDSALSRLRYEYSKLLNLEMKMAGYVPRLDINQDFTIQYNYSKQYFEFELTLYGVYVGKKKSEWILGIDETRVVPIPQNRLSEFLSERV